MEKEWPSEWISTVRVSRRFDIRNRGIDELELAAQHCANVISAGGDATNALCSFAMSVETARRIVADRPAFDRLVREYANGNALALSTDPLDIEIPMARASEPSDEWDTDEVPDEAPSSAALQ